MEKQINIRQVHISDCMRNQLSSRENTNKSFYKGHTGTFVAEWDEKAWH